jgi:TldD protein
MLVFRLIAVLALLEMLLTSCAPARARAGATDVVMRAMGNELARSVERLRLPGYEAPYFIAYTVKETQRQSLWGKVGALHEDERAHTRLAHVDVRVGDYSLDSSEDDLPDWPREEAYQPTVALPLDASEQAIQHSLWLITDAEYKQAVASYLKVKGGKVFEVPSDHKRPSFTPAPRVVHQEPPQPCPFDRKRWIRFIEEVSRELAADPVIFDSAVHVESRCERRWFVNSEGSRIVTNHPMYEVHVTGWARAPDGMVLQRTFDAYAPTETDLPQTDDVTRETRRIVKELKALRDAPELGPYTGPAILAPQATGVYFHEVLGHRLEGHRQDDDEEGQTFADYIGKTILPPFISVHDDPTRKRHAAVPLNGAYAFDDEGVASVSTPLVIRGVLRGFLMGRRPVVGFPGSNGHGRAAGIMRPVSRMGNLVVTAHETVKSDTLKSRLMEEAKTNGRPYGLIIRDVTGGATNTSSYGFQAFKAEAHMVYRVDARTGEETLVRGVDLVGTPLASLSKILSASEDTGVFNGYCNAESGMIPVSTVAPAVLFSEIELQRSAGGRSRAPILPAP